MRRRALEGAQKRWRPLALSQKRSLRDEGPNRRLQTHLVSVFQFVERILEEPFVGAAHQMAAVGGKRGRVCVGKID